MLSFLLFDSVCFILLGYTTGLLIYYFEACYYECNNKTNSNTQSNFFIKAKTASLCSKHSSKVLVLCSSCQRTCCSRKQITRALRFIDTEPDEPKLKKFISKILKVLIQKIQTLANPVRWLWRTEFYIHFWGKNRSKTRRVIKLCIPPFVKLIKKKIEFQENRPRPTPTSHIR